MRRCLQTAVTSLRQIWHSHVNNSASPRYVPILRTKMHMVRCTTSSARSVLLLTLPRVKRNRRGKYSWKKRSNASLSPAATRLARSLSCTICGCWSFMQFVACQPVRLVTTCWLEARPAGILRPKAPFLRQPDVEPRQVVHVGYSPDDTATH